jgi:hypothetical protein
MPDSSVTPALVIQGPGDSTNTSINIQASTIDASNGSDDAIYFSQIGTVFMKYCRVLGSMYIDAGSVTIIT